jgi:hypothetical protein
LKTYKGQTIDVRGVDAAVVFMVFQVLTIQLCVTNKLKMHSSVFLLPCTTHVLSEIIYL